MKFAVVVVLFALALGAQSSVVPISYTAVHGPVLYTTHPHGAIAVHAAVAPPAAVAVHASPVQIITSPAHVVATVPQVVAVAPAEGTYVAKTRGAVHVAPLPGHINSASSVNLEPAPGTI